MSRVVRQVIGGALLLVLVVLSGCGALDGTGIGKPQGSVVGAFCSLDLSMSREEVHKSMGRPSESLDVFGDIQDRWALGSNGQVVSLEIDENGDFANDFSAIVLFGSDQKVKKFLIIVPIKVPCPIIGG